MILNRLGKRFRKAVFLGLSFTMIIPSLSFAEGRYSDSLSKSAIVSDLETGRIVYEKNPDQKRAMASMTKMMTLLLALDALNEHKANPNDIVVIEKSDYNREGTNMKLEPGDRIPLNVLMDSMMIISANDSALAIARHIGGSYRSFVSMMNRKAKEIGMKATTFYNPNGLPATIEKNGKKVTVENTTTARDVLTLSKYLYSHYPEEVTEITSKKRFVYPKKKIDEENTNPLLPKMSSVDGLKTGYTTDAGYCLAYTMKIPKDKKSQADNRLFGVTMGAGSKEDREKASHSALDFINSHYKTKLLYKDGEEIAKADLNGTPGLYLPVVVDKNTYVYERGDEDFKTKVQYKKNNIFTGYKNPVGSVTVYDKNKMAATKVNLYFRTSPKDMNYGERLLLTLSTVYNEINSALGKKSGNCPTYSFF